MSAARTERLLNLLTLLLNARRPVSLKEIRELPEFDAFATSDLKSGERAFERDKAALIELGIPLRWVPPEQDDEDEGGGYLVDKKRYYLPELKLDPAELALLSIAGAAAATVEGFPGRAAVVQALAKLGFDVDGEALQKPLMAHAPLMPGADADTLGKNLATLHDAVAHRVQVKLRYKSLKGDASERAVDPYGLYYRQGAWYLVGYCHLRVAERTFHVGRIVGTTPVGKPGAFVVPDGFDISLHAQLRPWEYPGDKTLHVQIRLAERLIPAVREIFGSRAKLNTTAEGTFVHLVVHQPNALIAAVLPFGAAAEVLAPSELREEIADIYQRLAKRYAQESKV